MEALVLLVLWALLVSAKFAGDTTQPSVNLSCYRCFKVTKETLCTPTECSPTDRVCVSHALFMHSIMTQEDACHAITGLPGDKPVVEVPVSDADTAEIVTAGRAAPLFRPAPPAGCPPTSVFWWATFKTHMEGGPGCPQ
ncbi:PREDICTED: lymphocyte antigen 6L-like [Hipposideros armiger]|uniref:Lymphocyte antigen 6L-like n=1 Tax=Hipposideros armiger TaxID=186990 RepID=A0A8B7SLN9_HIPAR|nr:PREDICTED: lymphocyte antigen 6L-like [Hipposideros armiger]